MTDRKRDPLPEGYQFGDAGRAAQRHDALEDAWYADMKPVPFTPQQEAAYWNVIEGEHFTTNRDHGDEA